MLGCFEKKILFTDDILKYTNSSPMKIVRNKTLIKVENKGRIYQEIFYLFIEPKMSSMQPNVDGESGNWKIIH